MYKKISSDKLPQVIIINKKNKASALSDNLGGFSVKAEKGDTIHFETLDYTPQDQVYNGYDMVVYMQPQISLNQVTIKGQTKREELSDIMGSYRSKGIYYDGKPPVLSFFTSPITSFYELFGKGPGRARRFAEFAKREVEETSVDRRYSKAMVMRITGIKDTLVAAKFMEFYRPHFDEIKTWNDYELIQRVKRAYESFQRSGEIKEEKLY